MVTGGHFRLTHCISHRFSKISGSMTLASYTFSVFLCFVLSNCSAECDRGCTASRRRVVGVRCCTTVIAIGASETNVSGLNHTREKVPVICAVLWPLFRLIVIGDVVAAMCGRRAQVGLTRPSLLP